MIQIKFGRATDAAQRPVASISDAALRRRRARGSIFVEHERNPVRARANIAGSLPAAADGRAPGEIPAASSFIVPVQNRPLTPTLM